MKRRPLWPLLPPIAVVALGWITLFIVGWISGPDSDCGLRKFTGLHCPGCGGTRCAYDILEGNLLEALSHNAMVFIGALLFLIASSYLIIRMTLLGKPAPSFPDIKASHLWFVLAGVMMFTILRNIPVWPFSLLAP